MNLDAVEETRRVIAGAERRLLLDAARARQRAGAMAGRGGEFPPADGSVSKATVGRVQLRGAP